MMNKTVVKNDTNSSRWLWWLFGGLVFACLYLVFTKYSPLYIFDLDDWCYVSTFRHPIPSVKDLNPVKVLPETWMPLVSYLGAYLVYPLNGDYIDSLAIAYACILSLMITVYVLAAVGALGRWYGRRNVFVKICYAGIFLLAHFMPFLAAGQTSSHLFHATDVTCVFNYILPAMLNFILWMYFFDQDLEWKPLKNDAMGLLLLGLYLAVFSSLFHSIILMSLFGMQLLFALIGGIRETIRRKKPWLCAAFIRSYVRLHYPKLLALVLWLISMVFQLGGRSEDVSGQMDLGIVIQAFRELLLGGLNPWFCLAVVGINLTALILACRRRERKFLVKWTQILGCTGLTLVYIMLVTSKMSSPLFYFRRSDVIISWMAMVIFMTVFSLAYLVEKLPKTAALLPILLCCLVVGTVFHRGGYQQYNVPRLPSDVVKAIDEDILGQVKAAQAQGLTEVQVLIPESLTHNRWPLDVEETGLRISDSLFRHGITEQKIAVTIVPTLEKDLEYGLK